MADEPKPEDPKARLYRQIVRQTSAETLLRRMRLHGFWPQDEGLPAAPPAEAKERAKIEAELAELRKQAAILQNPQKALAEERKRRWQESKKRRAEARSRRAEEQQQRRAAFDAVRSGTIVHAGFGVSGGLTDITSNIVELKRRRLPVMHTSADLARLLGIGLPALRWLTYHRRGATLVHYHRYGIAKKTGGVRFISAPKPALKKAQRWVLENILNHLETEPPAHGFIRGRSIVTNASPHAGRAVVVNLDLRDFFPSITYRRVEKLFHRFGYSRHVSTVLALLCTEPPRVEAELDGKVYHVALGERVLPQGACTSPALTNALCRRLDRRLAGLAQKNGFSYTRYADDLTFSGNDAPKLGHLLRNAKHIVAEEGFTVHAGKTRIMRRGRRQEVTGVTVNQRPTVARAEVRALRALLHNAARHGLESQNREGRPEFAAYLRGRVEFICMVDPTKAPALRAALAKALAAR
jgi:retron-type reverse transcriptase